MDLNLELLTIQNPWWRGGSLKFDPVLVRQIMEKIILNLGRSVGYKTLAAKTRARTHLTPILIRYEKEIKQADWEIFKQAGFKKGIIISKKMLKNRGDVKIMLLSYFLMFYEEVLR